MTDYTQHNPITISGEKHTHNLLLEFQRETRKKIYDVNWSLNYINSEDNKDIRQQCIQLYEILEKERDMLIDLLNELEILEKKYD